MTTCKNCGATYEHPGYVSQTIENQSLADAHKAMPIILLPCCPRCGKPEAPQ